MQKKLIVVALAAAFTLPTAAHADNGNFTFYGVADLSYDFVNTSDGTITANGATAVAGTSKRVVSSNVSKFGFKGSEDLGEGLSANWQIEQQIDIDAAAKNTFASRNTFINVKSEKLGAVLFGIHDTPYKIAVRKLDMFGDNIGDNRALMGAPKSVTAVAVTATAGAAPFAGASSQGFELRPTNILMYTSPTFAGFNAAVAAVNLTEQNYVNTNKRNNLLSFAVMYDVAPFFGSVAHEAHKLESNVTTTQGQDESATRLGFGFKPEGKPFEVTAVYEKTTDNLGALGANVNGHSAAYLGAKYNLGNNAIKLGYAKAGTLSSVTDSGASQVSVGYDHGLSKRTKLYAIYTQITNGKGVNYGFSQSSGAATTNSGFGTSPSVVSLGVKHSF
ncbi:MAG: porin [Gallionella sp.]